MATSLLGRNEKGQLGLENNKGNHLHQKVRGIPKIRELSACSTSYSFFQVIDIEGYVWSCGSNQHGQLGLGDTIDRANFQKIVSLPALQQQSQIMRDLEQREIFTALATEQNKELKERIGSLPSFSTENFTEQIIKESLLLGIIPTVDWSARWTPIFTKNQQLSRSITEKKSVLSEKQALLQQLQNEIAELQTEVTSLEEERDVAQFFDGILLPIAKIEKELRGSFFAKLENNNYAEFSVDEVSLFLNIGEISTLIPFQRASQIDGEDLSIAVTDISVLGIKGHSLAKRKLEFNLKLLETGLFMKEEILGKSAIWRHKDVGKTPSILREYDIQLSEEIIKHNDISIGHLLYFKSKDLREFFGLQGKDVGKIVAKLQKLRKNFESFLRTTDR